MNLVSRAVNMLKSPKTEWDAVVAEEATVSSLYTGYAVPLSLVSHLAGFIGSAFIVSTFGVHYGTPYWLTSAAFEWILGLVGLYVAALIVNWLAPKFASTPNSLSAMKLVTFAMTGSWVGGIAPIIPVIGGVVALAGAVYSIYLFYLGIPKLMGTPQDKVIGYMVVCALVMIVITIAIGAVVASIVGGMFATQAFKIG